MREPPRLAIERRDEAGLGLLFLLAVVGGVGLAGHNEDLAEADMRDVGFGERVASGARADFEAEPTAGGGFQLRAEGIRPGLEGERLPRAVCVGAGEPGFEGGGALVGRELAGDEEFATGACGALGDLVIERSGEREPGGLAAKNAKRRKEGNRAAHGQ